MSKYIKVDDLQRYCDNQNDHSITPNEFQRMTHYDFGWHYIEDEGYPPLDETVVVVSETWLGIAMHLNRRVKRTGWGRTIECWKNDVDDDIIAWYGPIPDFKKREEKDGTDN